MLENKYKNKLFLNNYFKNQREILNFRDQTIENLIKLKKLFEEIKKIKKN